VLQESAEGRVRESNALPKHPGRRAAADPPPFKNMERQVGREKELTSVPLVAQQRLGINSRSDSRERDDPPLVLERRSFRHGIFLFCGSQQH
jgi:hypothetical protein